MAELTERQLAKFLKKEDADVVDAADDVIRELRRVARNYVVRFKGILNDPELRRSDVYNLREATDMINQLDSVLQEAGVGGLLDDYRSKFAPITRKALEYFELFDEPVSLRGIDADSLDAIITFSEQRLFDTRTNSGLLIDKLVSPVRTALLQGIVGDRPRDSVIAEVAEVADNLSINQAEVFVNDAYRRYHRHVRNEKAKALELEIFHYVGPNDAKTSDQCRALLSVNYHGVPGMLYKHEISTKLHPALRENPLYAGGHFGCRHSYWPVSEEYAVSRGFKIDRSREEEAQAA